MSPEAPILTGEEQQALERTVVAHHQLEEQYANLEQQHETASVGMWAFLATEVMFFGVLFLGLSVYRYEYQQAFEVASTRLNWIIGGINTFVLLTSSFTMVLGVHYAKVGLQRRVVTCLSITALLGVCFLCLKGLEYYTDYRDNLIPGWRFDDNEWVTQEGLTPDEVPHVKLFLMFYWIMTGTHALHVTIGIGVVTTVAVLAAKGRYSPVYYSPVDITGLYWHFVDVVWLFLLPMLYLLGTHTAKDFHF